MIEAGFTQQDIAWTYSAYYMPNIVFALFVGIVVDKFGEDRSTLGLSILTVAGQGIISFFPTLIPILVGKK